MKIEVHVNCIECDGYGFVADIHPNDPSCQNICCSECDGSGYKDYVDDYDSIVDAKEDWPNAVSFTYI